MYRNDYQEVLATPGSDRRTPIRLGTHGRRFGGQNVPSDGSPCLERSSSRPTSANNVRVNDDEEEKRQRRQNNAISMSTVLSPGCHTPKSAHSNRCRPVEAATSSLTNAQLTEHYADCIKLSTQNKINSKNAFGLHLIDHMLTVLKQRGDITNFQVASSTLDAGAKIYAGRVDSIYNDAFKVLGGLGSRDHNKEQQESQHNEGEGEEGMREGEEEEEGVGEGKKKGRKAKKSGTTIEKDPSVLDIADFDMDFRADPLFRKTAAAFDEGGVSGLLLKNIPVRDDSGSLQLDSSKSLVLSDQPSQEMTLDIDRDLLDLSALESRQICPTFANYQFRDSSQSEEDGARDLLASNEEAGQVDMVLDTGGSGGGTEEGPIPLADFTMLDAPPNVSEDCDDDTAAEDIAPSGQGELSVLGIVNDNRMAHLTSTSSENMSEKTARVEGLGLTDIIDPSEYSYFTSTVLESWAGPQHWKFRPRNSAKTSETEKTKDTKKRKTAPFKVDFRKIPEKSQFASGKASTRLSKAALKKLNASLNTLPQDTHTDVDVLHRLFNRPKLRVKRQKMESGVIEEDLEGDWYNYGNANDKLNFCPAVDDVDNDSDTGADAMDETALGFFNETMLPDSASSELPCSQQELEGETLVSQPHKVEKIHIDYAKTAKKIDVKRLKTRMWEFITQPPDERQSQGRSEEASEQDEEMKSQTESDEGDKDVESVEFSSLCSHLPSLVSTGMAKNVTVPICFVCLLHLANEKELKLSSKSEELSDFNILTS